MVVLLCSTCLCFATASGMTPALSCLCSVLVLHYCPAVQSQVVGLYALHSSMRGCGAPHLLEQLDDAVSDTLRESWCLVLCGGMVTTDLSLQGYDPQTTPPLNPCQHAVRCCSTDLCSTTLMCM